MRFRKLGLALGALSGPVLLCSLASALENDEFSGPAGQYGAGLRLDESQGIRAYGEMSFFRSTDSRGDSVNLMGWTLGMGFKPTPSLELEFALPVNGYVLSDTYDSEDQFGVGNFAVALNFLERGNSWINKGGIGVSFGPWLGSDDFGAASAVRTGFFIHGWQESWLHLVPAVHIFSPFRLEYGSDVRFTLDMASDFVIGTEEDQGTALIFQAAPGLAVVATDAFSFGARLPINLIANSSFEDSTQFSFEPYLRGELGKAFFATRLTINLDEPFGFSFSDGGYWGWHVAAGGAW